MRTRLIALWCWLLGHDTGALYWWVSEGTQTPPYWAPRSIGCARCLRCSQLILVRQAR